MIDTAIPDWLPESLINFDKRRKEFEVLAQIKLLQGAANAYHIESDPKFSQWFDSVLLLDEKEAFDLSCKMEPSGGVNGTTPAPKDQVGYKYRTIFFCFVQCTYNYCMHTYVCLTSCTLVLYRDILRNAAMESIIGKMIP